MKVCVTRTSFSRSPSKGKVKFCPFPQSPTDLNSQLKGSSGKEYRQQYGEFIQKYGGLYNPGFAFDNIFDDVQEKGWSKFLGIIKSTPSQENTFNVIKNMKAKKQLMNAVLGNKNKSLLVENENILKCYAYDQFFKNKSQLEEAKKNSTFER